PRMKENTLSNKEIQMFDEIIHRILLFLTGKENIRLQILNKKFYKICSSQELFKKIIENEIGLKVEIMNAYKKYVLLHKLDYIPDCSLEIPKKENDIIYKFGQLDDSCEFGTALHLHDDHTFHMKSFFRPSEVPDQSDIDIIIFGKYLIDKQYICIVPLKYQEGVNLFLENELKWRNVEENPYIKKFAYKFNKDEMPAYNHVYNFVYLERINM